MTSALWFITGIALGGFAIWRATRIEVRHIKADALHMLRIKHSLDLSADLSPEASLRRAGE